MTAILGLDIGTSAVKCVITQDRTLVGTGSAPLAISNPHPGWSEQKPEHWYDAAIIAVGLALDDAGITGTDVAGIGLSGQMHGAVLLGKGGQVLRPCILWNDNRSTVECQDLSTALPNIGTMAGVPPLPGFTAPKLMWVARHEPDIAAQIDQIVLPKDYIAYRLSGEFSTDMSDAAGTLWLDQETRQWDDALTKASATSRAWLPRLHYGHEQQGTLSVAAANDLGLSPGTPVFAGGGDGATGAISIGAAEAGRKFISLGTSGQYLRVDRDYLPNPEQMVHAFAHTLPDLRFRMAAMLNGARPLAWFAGVLKMSVGDMIAKAETAHADRVPLFLPYLSGERSPHGDPKIRASFYGMDDATNDAEMARAVVEAVAFMMRDAVDSFGDTLATDDCIPVLGGGGQSDFVLQNLADVLGVSVGRSAAGVGGPAYGAALLAAAGLGAITSSDLSFDAETTDVLTPKQNPRLAQRLLQYRTLYQTLRDVF